MDTTTLTRTDEEDAIAAQKGDRAARDRLVVRFLPVARRIATRNGATSVDDASQEAMLALLQVIERYDSERNKPFRSYAHAAIRWAIVRWQTRETAGAVSSLLQRPLSATRRARLPEPCWSSEM